MTRFRSCLCAIFILALTAICPGPARCEDVTPEQVAALLGTPPVPPANQAGAIKNVLDQQADIQTQALGKGNKDWNDKNPKWPAIYARVRADTEKDMGPTIDFALNKQAKEYNVLIAKDIKPEDVAAITAFYQTDEGRKYRDFNRRMTDLLGAPTTSKPLSGKIAPDDLQKYITLAQQSHMYQMMHVVMKADQAANRDTTGFSAVYFLLAAGLEKNPQESAALYKEYSGDIDRFTAFNQTPAQTHLHMAMANATKEMGARLKSIQDEQTPKMVEHIKDWQEMYKQEIGSAAPDPKSK